MRRTALTIRYALLTLILIALCWIPLRSQLNCSGGTCTPLLVGDGAAGTPAIAFSSDTSTGFYRPTGGRIAFTTGSANEIMWIGNETRLRSDSQIDWMSTTDAVNGTPDTYLSRSAASILQIGTTSGGNDGQIKGVSTNSNASVGSIGEYVTATVAVGSPVTLATGSASTITSLSLTAGDWNVWGVVDYIPAATTSVTVLKQGVQTAAGCVSAPALPTQDTFTSWETAANVLTAASNPAWATPQVRVSLAAATTVCLVTAPVFTLAGLTGYGSINARRMR